MNTVFIGCHMHDPDWPKQIALIKLDAPSFEEGSMAATLLAGLKGEAANGPFASALRSDSQAPGRPKMVHLYLYELAQKDPSLHATIQGELKRLIAQGDVRFDDGAIDGLIPHNVGFLMIEMSHERTGLSADVWGD